MYKPITIIILAAMLISGCAVANDEAAKNITNDKTKNQSTSIIEPSNKEIPMEIVDPKQTALDIISLIKLKDLPRLAAYVHPIEGVRFSPYGFVNTDTDNVMQANILQDALEKDDILEWGSYQGSGEPIKLSFAQYYDEFIFDHDFVNDAQVEYNKTIGSGNTVNNASEVYPDSFIAEFHYKGTKANDFMDWSSLRIVFAEYNKDWVIVGIIHDQWTI